MGDIFSILFIFPITNLLVAFYKIFEVIGVPYSLGFAIIALTVFIRLILYPFSAAQIKSAHKMQKVAPHIQALREKHKDDKKKQQEEMMKLYKEHGVNPATGCLPLIIQIPIFISLYNVLTTAVGSSSKDTIAKINEVLYIPTLHLNTTWDTSFFGIPLSPHPSQIISTLPAVALAIPLITGLSQFLLSKMMMPEHQEATKTNQKKDDFQSILQTQSLYIFPVMIGFFSFQFPVGLSLYWNTFTLFGILQQYRLAGSGALKPWLENIKNKYGRKA